MGHGVGANSEDAFNLALGAGHDAPHPQASGHHHHDDGSIHVDNSDTSIHHTHADDGANYSWLFAAQAAPMGALLIANATDRHDGVCREALISESRRAHQRISRRSLGPVRRSQLDGA